MYIYEFQKRVRYAETDQMGYLYHGNYATYYEIGRVEMLRSLGFTYKSMEDDLGILMPVMSLDMRFVRPGRYDELLTIETTLREVPDKTIIFHVRIFNEKKKLVNGGRIKLCFVDANTNKTVTAPEFLLEAVRPFFISEN